MLNKHIFIVGLCFTALACHRDTSDEPEACSQIKQVPSFWVGHSWDYAYSDLSELYAGSCLDTICPFALFEVGADSTYSLAYSIPYFATDSSILKLEWNETGKLIGTRCHGQLGLGEFEYGELFLEPSGKTPYKINYTFGGIGNQLQNLQNTGGFYFTIYLLDY